MTQPNIAPQAFKYVCACGGGMRSQEYLDRHVATAADPTKETWYSLAGIWQLFGLPEGTHGRLGDFVPQYNTQMGAADFQANVAQWKAFLAERGLGEAVVPNTSPDGICVALTKATGLRCDRRAKGGADICAPHSARPGRGRITVHPTMVGQVPAPTGVPAPAAGGFVPPAPPAPPVPAPSAVEQGIAAIMSRLDSFNSRITSMEEIATQPPVYADEAPAELVEEPAVTPSESPISKLLEKLGKSS